MPLPGDGIPDNLAASAILHLFRRRRRISLWVSTRCFRPQAPMRVVSSVLVRIADEGQHYFVRNLHRPETFGPFGGVVKYHAGARPFLDSIHFEPHRFGDPSEMDFDLRGFIPRRHLFSFIRWYESGADRESATECAKREIREELGEANISTGGLAIERLSFRRKHDVIEGPEFVDTEGYHQFRIFEILTLETDKYGKAIITRLKKQIDSNADIARATHEEIRRNRSSNDELLSYLSSYLLGATKPHYEVPFAKAPHFDPNKAVNRSTQSRGN